MRGNIVLRSVLLVPGLFHFLYWSSHDGKPSHFAVSPPKEILRVFQSSALFLFARTRRFFRVRQGSRVASEAPLFFSCHLLLVRFSHLRNRQREAYRIVPWYRLVPL